MQVSNIKISNGMKGGYVVAEGTPEEVAANPKSVTGSYLKKALDRGVRAGWLCSKKYVDN